MRSLKITNGSGAFLCALVLMTNGFSVLSGSRAGRSAWIAHILALVAALLCAALFARICDANPQKTFYEALEYAVGKSGAKVMGVVFLLTMLTTCVVSMTVFSRFVQITALPQTPQIIIPLLIAVIAALSLARNLTSAAGAARLLFWFCALVFFLLLFLGLFTDEKTSCLPLGQWWYDISDSAAEIFINRFGQIPALMAVYVRMKDKKTRKAYFLTSVAGAGVALTAVCAVTLMILGSEYSAIDFYPVYTAMSVHSIGGFIQHTEVFLCMAMTVCLFFKVAVCLMFAEDMLNGIFGITRKKGVAIPIALICVAATQIIYRDTSALRGIVEWKSAMWWVAAGELLVPVVLVLFTALSGRKKEKQGNFHRN